MKLLYLTEWYPHRYDPMPGLFVRKHAQAAASAGVEVGVLYLHPDPQAHGEEVVEQRTGDVREIYVYYSGSFLRALRCGWQQVQERWGKPEVVQLNVLSKTGLLALYLRHRYHIPYVLVEHWSGYLPENNAFRGGWHGLLMRHIARQADCILPVSAALENAMQACGIRHQRWQRVRNVVDDFFFTAPPSGSRPHQPYRFLHVSCFDEASKNIHGILRATAQLAKQRTDFELVIVGTGPDFRANKTLSDSLGLTDKIVRFVGEQTPLGVRDAMLASDCFILFSRYENAPVVLSESMATGLPIIATRAGGMPEMVDSPIIGTLVESENEAQLAEAMEAMIEAATQLTPSQRNQQEQARRQRAYIYSTQAVGDMLKQTYADAFARQQAR